MTRPNCRRTLRLESLEERALLTAGGPSPAGQYTLELLNRARTNPSDIAQRITSNLDPSVVATLQHYSINLAEVKGEIASNPAKPPLAWNSQLADAAQDHSQDMADHKYQDHIGSDGSTVEQRMDRVGYVGRTSGGENAFAYGQTVDQAMQAFLIDWGVASRGHRNNILQPDRSPEDAYREVGIGIVNTSNSGIGPMVMTQDFGSRTDEKAELLGVVYQDSDHNDFYSPGEGLGNVTIKVVNEKTNQETDVQTWDAGGYQVALDPGTYKVSAVVGDKSYGPKEVTIGNQNVKVDFNLAQEAGVPASQTVATHGTYGTNSVLSNGTVQYVDPKLVAQNFAASYATFFKSWTTWSVKKS